MTPKALFISNFDSSKGVHRKILSVIMTIALFLAGFFYCNRLLVNKASLKKYEQFFNTDKEFDVLFFGSSHMINGVSPLDLFRDYGIAGYNFAMHSNYTKSGYFLLREALAETKRAGRRMPKAVVLDVYGDGEDIWFLHNAWDRFPISGTKREMAKALAGEKYGEIIMPFSLYHSRWTELSKDDFRPEINELYGAELRYGVEYPGTEIIADVRDRKEIDGEKLSYVERIRKLCESHGIALVLVNLPYSYNPDWQREANSFYEYAEERGVYFVNYMNEEIGLDFDIDFCDQGHLNPAGMRRMTDELGELLRGLGVGDRRQEPCGGQWQKEYEAFIDYRVNRLKEISQAKVYLMSLQDPDLASVVYVKRKLLEDVQTAKLVKRLEDGENQVVTVEDGERLMAPDGKEGWLMCPPNFHVRWYARCRVHAGYKGSTGQTDTPF